MLFRETVVICCENHKEHTNTLCGQNVEFCNMYNSVRTHRKHYVTATKPNRLMLFRETVAVCCENHTEHTNTLCGQNVEFCNMYNSVRTHRKHYVTATKPNRLMRFRETVAVCCENHTEHTNTLCG
jgi:predicted Zn-dependent protease with MMP-like domain